MKKSEQIKQLQQQIKDLENRLVTEKFIKNSLHSFMMDCGTSQQYYSEYRYQYCGNNFAEFKKTALFPEWSEKRKNVLLEKEIKLLTN